MALHSDLARSGTAPATAREPATVLIVDDTPGNLELLGTILRREYRVKAATSGTRALQIAAAEPQPDLILLVTQSGRHFDPEVVTAFVASFDDFCDIARRYGGDDEGALLAQISARAAARSTVPSEQVD
ncbi:MAG TPA: hypothetical protein VFR86_06915 [Burkholderiaceae bacterium]|nr:hypothetical protein [Burkholderiaceae bacterium]